MRFSQKCIDSNGTIPRTNAHTLTHMFQFVPEKRTEAVDDILDATPPAYFRVQNTQSWHFHVCYVPGGRGDIALRLWGCYYVDGMFSGTSQRD